MLDLLGQAQVEENTVAVLHRGCLSCVHCVAADAQPQAHADSAEL